MKTYTFTLVLSGFTELREDVEDCLFESGCDDALLSFRDGVPYLDLDREAKSIREAILSAINPSSCSQKLSCMISICYPFEKRDFDTTDSNKLYKIVFTILPGL